MRALSLSVATCSASDPCSSEYSCKHMSASASTCSHLQTRMALAVAPCLTISFIPRIVSTVFCLMPCKVSIFVLSTSCSTKAASFCAGKLEWSSSAPLSPASRHSSSHMNVVCPLQATPRDSPDEGCLRTVLSCSLHIAKLGTRQLGCAGSP